MFDVKPNKNKAVKEILSDITNYNQGVTKEQVENLLKFFELRNKIGEIGENDLEIVRHLDWSEGTGVFLAKHKHLGFEMIKKLIDLDMRSDVKKIILDELTILYDINSPFIVGFYGLYTEDDELNICTEYMDRGSLELVLLKVNRVPENIIAKIAESVLKGLKYLKDSAKIIHSDIKPSNILINSKGEIKLSDVVINKYTGHNKRVVKSYNSPERLEGGLPSFKDDIWSLGFCLVEMAVGRYPIPDIDEDEITNLFKVDQFEVTNKQAQDNTSIFEILSQIVEKVRF